jgi:type IV secretory pathway VirB10-like protein
LVAKIPLVVNCRPKILSLFVFLIAAINAVAAEASPSEEEQATVRAAPANSTNAVLETNKESPTNPATIANPQTNAGTEPPPPLPPASPPPTPSPRNTWAFIVCAIAALSALWTFSRKQPRPPN